MTRKLIILPEWVYTNLSKYGNAALPYCKYTKQQLESHLSYRMNCKVRCREAAFKVNDKYITLNGKYTFITKNYYIAEIV